MIVAEIDAHRRTGRSHQLVKLEALSVAFVQRDAVRSVVDHRDDLAIVLFDASRIAADAAHSVRRQGLEQDVRADVVDLDLVGHWIIGHDHGQRGGAVVSLNVRRSHDEHEQRRRTAKTFQSRHTGSFVNDRCVDLNGSCYLADALMGGAEIGAMMCAYGVPGYITYGPPLCGSVETPASDLRAATRTIRWGGARCH